ncbi:MAG TPA: hypothetical protein VNP72_10065 [Longimicrobium sp.]|nr:hypothetical protein [Longimicrobium sp.]
MNEQNGTDIRTATIKHLREVAAAQVENTSLRSVARAIGMSPTGLKKFLGGTAPYSPTLRRLRTWYVQHGSRQGESVGEIEASAALDVLVHDLSPDGRRETASCLLDCLGRGYDGSGRTRPEWVASLQGRLGESAEPAVRGEAA